MCVGSGYRCLFGMVPAFRYRTEPSQPLSEKEQIRRRMDCERRRLAENGRQSWPGTEALWEQIRASGSTAVAGFCPLPGEPDVIPVLIHCGQQGVEVLLPRYRVETQAYVLARQTVISDRLVKGHYGVLEPGPECESISREEQESEHVFWLVPGVAFDLNGGRLGRGRGYYDRLLRSARGLRVGICYEWQLLPSLPCEAHDVRMNALMTEKRWIKCSSHGH